MTLSDKPPRRPRAELAGVVFLPRSIDKVRATLPGGDPGPYNIPGFTQLMLEKLGISVESFSAAVAAAESDDEVGAFVRANTTQARIDEWNGWVTARLPDWFVQHFPSEYHRKRLFNETPEQMLRGVKVKEMHAEQ